MLVRSRAGWEIPEAQATSAELFTGRRRFLQGAAAALGAAACGIAPPAFAAGAASGALASLYPAPRNAKYKVHRPITPAKLVETHNNYYEFGSQKDIWRLAQALPLHPWTVKIDGMVEKPLTFEFDDLVRRMRLQERVYRFRCVEAWAATVPWTGFPMRDLVALARPAAGVRYVAMQSFENPSVAPGQKAFWYPWPYQEGLTLAEATNELTLLVTGLYGKPAPAQNGAPLRLITPWKYGFKSIKAIVRFTFTDKQPPTFWDTVDPSEYGFWANVNPAVPHPRWSQATERVLGLPGRRPTLIWNGYGDYVAAIYAGTKGQQLFR
jgi:methionine sulfoxide reductase catalytic subunit